MKDGAKRLIFRGLFAGIMITIACIVYLMCEDKLVGAVLFSAGLFFILSNDGALFTGMCGMKTPWLTLIAVLLLNAVGALVAGALTWPAFDLAQPAETLIKGKLAYDWPSWLTNGILCGVLMYLAVAGYRKAKDGPIALASVLYAIPVFIVARFEHSIADLGYLAIAIPMLGGDLLLQALIMVLVVAVGNVIGSKVTRLLVNVVPVQEEAKQELNIERFALEPHLEGGLYRELYRDETKTDEREASAAIYYYLGADEHTAFHVLDSDEYWLYHSGAPLELWMFDQDGNLSIKKLGMDEDAEPCVLMRSGAVFGARHAKGAESGTLVSCVTVPEFSYSQYRLLSRREMLANYPESKGFWK